MAEGGAAPDGGLGALGETIIPAVNALQDIFSQASLDFKLDLPQVAVIGSQSSGKSSVLEALVGRDFLPRGPEICTRRPLVLQLVKQGDGSGGKEWGEFLHVPGRRFTDFELIRQEIQAETDRVSGTNKGVSEKPIRLKIFSPNVLTMTLVDLPGLARVPVGEQPPDIEERIRRMIAEYIRHPTCLILAVSPANADLANSDALSMARAVDPAGHRTIGVLTKLDIMDRGTNAAAVLRNEVVPLQLGYIGVVNRCQQDLDSRRSMGQARAAEAAFFDGRPEYSSVRPQCGTASLARRLNAILVQHIQGLLPSLRAKIEQELDRRAAELLSYGDAPVGDTPSSRGALLLQLLDAYSQGYTQMLEGCSERMPVRELAGGARIRHIFREIFTAGLEQLNPARDLSDEDIRTAIKNSGGVKGSLLIPDAPFELLVRRSIARLLPPCLQCKDFVHAELLRIAGQCAPAAVARFPQLEEHLMHAVEAFINAGAAPAERMIRDCVDCELAFINTDHPAFLGGSRAVGLVMERRAAAAAGGGLPEDEPRPARASTPVEIPGPRSAKPAGGLRLPQPNGHASSGEARPRGRVPLADASNHASRLGLKGMEPALYAPEDLLSAGELPGSSAVSAGGRTPPPEPEPEAGGGGWFSHWFGLSEGRSAAGSGGSAAERAQALSKPPWTLRVQAMGSEQEQVQVEVTRLLVDCYFTIVKRNLQDAVPKAIMHFLVLAVQRGLQQRLIRELYREDLFAEVMAERPEIAARREACQRALRALHQATATLNALPQALVSSVGGGDGSGRAGLGGSEQLQLGASQAGYSRLVPQRTALSGAARLAVTAMASVVPTEGPATGMEAGAERFGALTL